MLYNEAGESMSWYELTRSTKFTIITIGLFFEVIDAVIGPTLENPIWIVTFQVAHIIVSISVMWLWLQYSYQQVNKKYKKYKKRLEEIKAS